MNGKDRAGSLSGNSDSDPYFFVKEMFIMSRIRTIPKAVEEMKKKDPNTCITLSAMRRWVKQGKVKSFDGGKIRLVDLDEVELMVKGVSHESF